MCNHCAPTNPFRDSFQLFRFFMPPLLLFVVAMLPALGAPQSGGGPVKPTTGQVTRQDLTVKQLGIVSRYLVAEGEKVKAGALIIQLDNRAIKAAVREAQAAREVALANEDLAQDVVKRLQELSRSQAATEQQLVESKIKYAQARAGRRQAEAALARLDVQLEDTQIRAEISGVVRGLPTVLGLAVQPGQSLGRIEAVGP